MSVFKYVNNTAIDIVGSVNTVPAWDYIQASTRLADLEKYVNVSLDLYINGVEQNNFVELNSSGDSITGKLSIGTKTLPVGSKTQRIQTLVFGGDSISTYQDTNGWSFSGLSNLTGVQLRGTNQRFPSGASTLTFIAATNSLVLTANGDTIGIPVQVKDGLFTLYSGNGVNWLRVGITSRLLPTVDKTDTITTASLLARRNAGSIAYAIDAFTNRRFTILPDMGISGNTTQDMLNRYQQIAELNADIFFNIIGTNDQLNSLSPQQISDNIEVVWNAVSNKGTQVAQYLVMPRNGALAWGGGAGTDTAATAATYEPKILETNRLNSLKAMQPQFSNISILDIHSPLVDVLTGKMKDFASEDGLHTSGGATMIAAIEGTALLNRRSPDTKVTPNISLYSAYNSTSCPGGNLLNNNRGSMAGSGGTLGTGATLTPVWSASTVIALNSHVIVGDRLYRCTTSGTTGTLRPTHTSGTALDNTVSWQFIQGDCWVLTWAANTAYNLEDIVVTSAGKKYKCTVAGTSHATTAPTAVASIVTDNTVTWQFLDTGCSSGLAANWNLQRHTGSSITVSAHRVKSTDKRSDWQELVIQGSSVDCRIATSEEISIYPGASPITFANMVDGDRVDTSVQLQVMDGSGCGGIYMEAIYTGISITHDNNCLKNLSNGFVWSEPFRLALNPITWVGNSNSTITATFPRVRIQSQINGVFRVRIRDMDMHKL